MRATVDTAGRMVLPKALRDQVGLRPGEVEVFADGTGIRIEPIPRDELENRDGRLVVSPAGAAVDDETVRALREAGWR